MGISRQPCLSLVMPLVHPGTGFRNGINPKDMEIKPLPIC